MDRRTIETARFLIPAGLLAFLILGCLPVPGAEAVSLPRAVRLELKVVDMPLGIWENLKDVTIQRGRVGSIPTDKLKWLTKEMSREASKISLLSSASTVMYLDSMSEIMIGRVPGYAGRYKKAANGPLPVREKLLLGLWGRFRLSSLKQEDEELEALISCQLAMVRPGKDADGEKQFLRQVATPSGPLEVPEVKGFHGCLSIQVRDGETRVLAACASPFTGSAGDTGDARTTLVLLKALFLDEATGPITTPLTSRVEKNASSKRNPGKFPIPDEQGQNLLIDPSEQRDSKFFLPSLFLSPDTAPVLISGKVLRLPVELVDYILKRYINKNGEIDDRGRRLLGKAIKQKIGTIVDSFDLFSLRNSFFRLVYGREHGFLARHEAYSFKGGDGTAYGLVPIEDSVLQGMELSGSLLVKPDNQLIMNLTYTPDVSIRETTHTWGGLPAAGEDEKNTSRTPATIVVEQPETVQMKMALRYPMRFNTTIITQDLGLREEAGRHSGKLEKYVFLIRVTE
ncbi:MAG: hypothetical protein QGH40_09400 [bacterium]|nr:hypothetical protein [bacterium]